MGRGPTEHIEDTEMIAQRVQCVPWAKLDSTLSCENLPAPRLELEDGQHSGRDFLDFDSDLKRCAQMPGQLRRRVVPLVRRLEPDSHFRQRWPLVDLNLVL